MTAEAQSISISDVMNGHQEKGGEKTKSEWEELETLTKDELIIQLMRWKTLYSIACENMDDDSPLVPKAARKYASEDEPGEITTPAWAEKIALYGAMHPKDGMFYSCDLADYGLTLEQSDEVCEKLHAAGRLKMPAGVEFYVSKEGDE